MLELWNYESSCERSHGISDRRGTSHRLHDDDQGEVRKVLKKVPDHRLVLLSSG